MDIQKEIEEAIEKNLSAEVGGLLKKRLEKIEELEKENKDLNDQNKNQSDQIKNLSKENESLKDREWSVNAREQQVEVREQKVTQIEHTLEIHKLKENFANEKADLAREFLQTVFRPSAIRKTMQKQVPYEYMGSQYDPNTGVTKEVPLKDHREAFESEDIVEE